MAQLKSDPSFNVRVAALRALQALKVSNMDEVMKVAVADADANVRRAALGVLPSLALSDAAKVQSLTTVIRSGTVADQQAGFDVLGTLKSGEAERALSAFFDELAAGKSIWSRSTSRRPTSPPRRSGTCSRTPSRAPR